jgi:hypothetical protein
MKKISLVLVVLLVFGLPVLAEEWLNFNDRGETAPVYDVKNPSSTKLNNSLSASCSIKIKTTVYKSVCPI